MLRDIKYFISLSWPPFAALLVFLLNFQIELVTTTQTVINLPLSSGVSISVPSPLGAHLIINILAAAFLCVAAFRDYSSSFDKLMMVEAHWDDETVAASLGVFTKAEFSALGIHPDWRTEKRAVLHDLTDRVLARDQTVAFRFTTEGATIMSSGRTTVLITKISRSLQDYAIMDSQGEMEHRMQVPGKPDEFLFTRFKLAGKGRISIELRHALTGTIVVKLSYNQIIALPNKETVETTLVTATKVRFFPFKKLHDTIYFAEQGPPNAKLLVPVASAVNTPYG